MRIPYLLFTFLICIFSSVNILLGQYYQVDTLEQIETEYYANRDFWKASQLSFTEANAARVLFQKAIQKFELEENWKAYIDANAGLVKTYHWTTEFEEGIKIGEHAFQKIKTQAPTFRKECGQLVYQTGLAFPYPYKNKIALQKFSYAKNLVKNHSTIDRLLLGEIYNTMGLSSMQLKDFKNASDYLFKAKNLLEYHPFFEECEYGWESGGGEPGMIITSVELDENGDTLSIAAVSANPPFVYSVEKCGNYLVAIGKTYTNIGTLFYLTKEMDKSLEYLELGLDKILRAYGYPTDDQLLDILPSYRALGKYYYDIHEYEQSNYFFKKTIQLIKESKTKKSYFIHLVSPESFYLMSKNQINIVFQSNMRNEEYIYESNKAVSFLEQSLSPIFSELELSYYKPELDSTYTYYPSMFASEVKELKVNIYSSVMDFFLKEGDDEIPTEIYNFLDTTLLGNQLLKEFDDYDYKTKVFYYQVHAEYHKQSNDVQKAIGLLKKSLQMIPPSASGSERAYSNYKLAKYYQILQNQDSALFYNHQALIASCHDFQNTNYIILPRVHQLKDVPFLQEILLHKASLIDSVSNDAKDLKSRKELLLLAVSVIDLADQYHQQQLKKFNFLKTARGKGFINESVNIYLKGISIAYKFHEIDYTDKSLDKAFYYVQKMKAQQLMVSYAENEASGIGKLSKEFLEEEKKLKAIISKYELKIFNTEQETQDTFLIEEIIKEEERVFNTEKELEKLVKKMEAENPEYYESKYSIVPETYASIQHLMDDKELILEYVIADRDLYIFSIDKNQPLRVTKTPEQDSIYFSHAWYLKELVANSPMLRKSTRKKFIRWSHLLYQQYLAPIEDQLKNKKRIVIIGAGSMNYIPFELLLPSSKVKRFKKLDFLIKDYEISYHYSTSLLAKAKRKTYNGESSIYTFAPIYDEGNSQLASLDITNIDDILNSNFRALDGSGGFSPLPISELEVKKIMELFNDKSPSTLSKMALREDAKEDALKIHLEKPYQFIHIAGHSFANALFPKYSGIACYKTPYKQDDILFTDEIYNLRTTADLVTLSSCESGFGKYTEAEGLLGLNRAFISAGTPNVVYSLWKVYDKANAVLMVDFYNNILAGKNYSESLRAAKLKLLKNKATASPHFWSPYLLIGR